MGDNITDPTHGANPTAEAKGKGKAEPQDVSMGEEDSSSDEETGAEDEAPEEGPEEEDEDNMEEIDTDNIISGSRTRGKNIDWLKANEDNKDELDDDDDDDDDDFEEKDEDMRD